MLYEIRESFVLSMFHIPITIRKNHSRPHGDCTLAILDGRNGLLGSLGLLAFILDQWVW